VSEEVKKLLKDIGVALGYLCIHPGFDAKVGLKDGVLRISDKR